VTARTKDLAASITDAIQGRESTRRRLVIVESVTEWRDGIAYAGQRDIEVRCDRCRHWKAPLDPGASHDTEYRYGLDGAHHCARIDDAVGDDSANFCGGHGSEKFTLPDFGCPLFKETTNGS
jgi:hypothetical protein